jgi:hypothetical protein
MGYTIEDMLVTSRDRYQMKLLAGEQGCSNSINWILMLEDTTVIQTFAGKELAVTRGIGFPSEDKLLELVKNLVSHHAAGLVINTGFYLHEIPDSVVGYCNDNDLPLMTIPWEIDLTEFNKDTSIRIFFQQSADEQISTALIHAIEEPGNRDAYYKDLLAYFDLDGSFQVVLISDGSLDEMDTIVRRRLGYRLEIYLEDITHNGNFFYYDSCFVLIVNDVGDTDLDAIVNGFIHRVKRRMPQHKISVGIGTKCNDIANLHTSYKRAKAAVNMALHRGEEKLAFDEMNLYRLLYSVSDQELLREITVECLEPLMEHDRKHHSNYVETLKYYLQYGGSIQAVAEAMYTHRNTVIYRINNIKELIGCSLETPEERLPYQIAYLIQEM